MKHNTKKGFTLVELLVVIAILAILATVSVVGYTSFIESANVAVDEDLVAQLNNFLAAYKVNNTEDITADNAWEVTQEILELSGLDKINGLVPKSKDNHFYFNVDEQEYQLVTDTLVTGNGSHFFNIIGFAADNLKPGVFTNDKNQTLFLVDTTGWDVADVVRGFYTLDNYESINEFLAEAQAMTGKYSNLAYWANNTVFVTKDGNFVVDLATKHSNIVIYSDATVISNIKQNLEGGSEFTSDADPMITVSESTTIKLSGAINVTAGGLNIQKASDAVKVTLVIDAKSWDDIKENVDADFTNTNVVVRVNGANYVVDGAHVYTEENFNGAKDTVYTTLRYKNPMKDFDIDLTGSQNKVHDGGNNTGYVAWDGTDITFKVDTASVTGVDSTSATISTYAVRWSITSIVLDGVAVTENLNTYVTIDENTGKITFNTDANGLAYPVDEVTVKATARVSEAGWLDDTAADAVFAEKSFTVNVGRITDASLNIAEKEWLNTDVTLIHSGEGNTYYVVLNGTPSYNANKNGESYKGDSITLNETIKVTYDGTGLNADGTGNSVSTVGGNGTGTLTVVVGDYVKYTINVSVYDTTDFPVKPKQKVIYLGNSNTVNFSDLFEGDAPAGAEIRICDGLYNDDNYMNWTRDYLADRATLEDETFFAEESNVPVNETIKFNGVSGANPITLAVYLNGVRISDDVTTVHVVKGANVRNYADISTLIDTNAKDKDGVLTYPITDSVVLLGDVSISGTYNYFSIPANTTLYGNLFKVDASGARNTDGIILLQGTIRDAKVVGSVYGSLALSIGDSNGASVIYANNGAVIDNCYLANTRSPLRVNDGVVTVKDTVLFGGRYANIDIVGGTVKIQGTVTTVQQPIKTSDNKTTVIGVGISAWFNDTKKTVVVEDGADLIQYNFVNSELTAYLPSINILDIVDIMDLKDPFNDIMTNYADDYGFVGSNGKVYANSGMVSTDAYMLTYTVTGEPSSTNIIKTKTYNKGATKTVKITTAVADNDTFEIYYNKNEFKCKTVEDTDGVVTVTGAQLKAGVVFETIKKLSYSVITGDATNFSFLVANNNYKTINLSGCQDEYNSLMYTYNDDLRSKLGLVESVSSMHGRGMHYGFITAEIYTPVNTAGSEYYTRLEEYINNVVGGDQVYLPDHYVMNYTK